MEDNISGKLSFDGIEPSNICKKIVERQIEKWIRHEQSLLFSSKKHLAFYTAHICREDYRYYTCHLEIDIGRREFTGLGEGRSIHEAVSNTLKHLKPKLHIEKYYPTPLPSLCAATV